MGDFTVDTCFGCGAPIERAPGNFYCGACIAEQSAAHAAERRAFDAFHAFADRVARDGVTPPS